VEVDWTGAGWGSAADIVADVWALECQRGIGSSAQQGFVASAGQLSVTLNNESGDYSPNNASGPYFGYVKSKAPIRLRLSNPLSTVFWVGRIDHIQIGAQVGNIPTVTLSGTGNFIRLSDSRKVTPTANAGDTTDVILAALLDASGVATADQALATGEITTGVWSPVEVVPMEEARRIVSTELGRFYEAKDGSFTFENRHYRRDTTRSNTVQLTISDNPSDNDLYRYRQIDQLNPDENIYDLVTVNFTPFFTLDAGIDPVPIWEFGGTLISSIVVPPGGSRIVTIAPFNYPYLSPTSDQSISSNFWNYSIVEFVDPTVSGGDPDLVVVGSPYAAQSSLSISNITHTAHSVTFTLSNSDPSLNLVMGSIRLIGRRGVTGAPVRSVVGSGYREYPLPGPYYPSAGPANTAARWLYDYYSSPRDLLEIEISAIRNSTIFTALMQREISDRIHVTAAGVQTKLGLTAEFFLEGIRWTFTREGDIRAVLSLSACLPNTHDTEDDTGLPTGMSPYYAFEEASGPIVDVVGTYDLGNHGSTAAVGIIGRARDFDGASNQYALNSSAGIPDTDVSNTHEWNGWVKDGGAWTDDQVLLQKDIGEDFAYRVFVHQGSGLRYIQASITTDDGIFTTLGSDDLNDGNWHFWRFVHDADLLRIGTQLDLGPWVYETYTGTPLTFTDGLVLGGTGSSTGGGTPTAGDTTTYTRKLTISPATSLTESFTNTSGDFLLVGITYARGVGSGITSITYDGAPLTFLYNAFSGSGTNDMYVGTNSHYHAVAYLVAPSTGAHNLVFSFGGTDVTRITVGARTFIGVDPLTPFSHSAFAQADSTAPSVTVTSATGELVVDTVGTGMHLLSSVDTITGHGAGQTQQYNQQDDASVNGTNGAGSYKDGAASVTTSWTIDHSIGWVSVGISLVGTGGSILPLNCTLDETGYMAARLLTDAEAAERWNGGAGSTATGGSGNVFVPQQPSNPPVMIPSGPTSGRPGAPLTGALYFNTDTNQFEYWDGDSWNPAADPVGADIPYSIIDAKGDLIAGTADNTAARVAVGSNGKVLTADSGVSAGVSWQTPSTGAPADAHYITTQAESGLSAEVVLGTGVIMYGVVGSRPSASIAGRLYFATDVTGGTWYRDNGATWDTASLGLSALASYALTSDLANYIAKSTGTAKGDLLVFTASGTVTRLPVGVDGQVLVADSSVAEGVRWSNSGDISNGGNPSVNNGWVVTLADVW
jgi:hypothetical protein